MPEPPTLSFPRSPCFICKKPIANLRGIVFSDNFNRVLHSYPYLSPTSCRMQENFMNAVTSAYIAQFSEEFYKDRQGATDLADFFKEMDLLAKPLVRLEAVCSKKIEKYAHLLLHEPCLPEEILGSGYSIPLDRIDTAEKALDWTMHLNEKGWFEPSAWIKFLESLFGRDGVA